MACERCGSLIPDTFRSAVLAGRARWVAATLDELGVAAEIHQRAAQDDLPNVRFPRNKTGEDYSYRAFDVCEECARDLERRPGGSVVHEAAHLVYLEPGTEESSLEQLRTDRVLPPV